METFKLSKILYAHQPQPIHNTLQPVTAFVCLLAHAHQVRARLFHHGCRQEEAGGPQGWEPYGSSDLYVHNGLQKSEKACVKLTLQNPTTKQTIRCMHFYRARAGQQGSLVDLQVSTLPHTDGCTVACHPVLHADLPKARPHHLSRVSVRHCPQSCTHEVQHAPRPALNPLQCWHYPPRR